MKKSHQLELDDCQHSDRSTVRNERTYPAIRRLLALVFVCATTFLLCEAVPAQQSSVIEITDPKVSSSSQILLAQGAVDLTFAVSSTDITKVRVMVLSAVDAATNDMDIDPEKRQQSVTVNLFKGANKITLIGFKDGQPDSSISAYIDVTCNGRKCGATKTITSEAGKDEPSGKSSDQISIKQPHQGDQFKNVPQRTIQVFKINQTVRDRFPTIEPGKEYIAFVTPDRTRFFRQYFGGLRLKKYFVRDPSGSGEFNELEPIFPGILELTFGQPE